MRQTVQDRIYRDHVTYVTMIMVCVVTIVSMVLVGGVLLKHDRKVRVWHKECYTWADGYVQCRTPNRNAIT